MMTQELKKPYAPEYGIEETKAKEISGMFKPMLDKMEALEVEYNRIVTQERTLELSVEAKELRLKYVKVRTGTKRIHQKLKRASLLAGRFIDGWKNAQLMAGESHEQKLKEIEDHFEIIERERIRKLFEERSVLLNPYMDFMPSGLGEMEEHVFQNLLAGSKKAHEDKIAAEKKAEADRIERVRLEKEERERIQKENTRLRDEANKRKLQEEREARERAAIAAKEKAERDALIEENERVRREAEKAKKALQDAKKVPPSPTFLDKPIPEYIIEPVIEQSPASLSEKSKMDALISELQMLKWKYNFREENYVKVYNDVGLLIDKVLNHIDTKLHNLENE